MTPGDQSDEIHFIGDEAPSPPEPKKRGFTIRRLMIAVAMVAFLFGIVRPIYLFFDAFGHGPYTVAYNRECQRLADEAQLIGRPEKDVIAVLGEPTEIWDYEKEDANTYNYFPIRYAPAGIFQVHCHGGIVTSLEQMDD